MLAEVERYASGMQTISTFAAELSHRRRGMLRIVALPAMAMGFLPRFVASFIAGRSLASVYLHGMPSYLVVEAVASGQAEIGFAAAPPERPGLLIEPLESKAMLVVPLLHRLARRRSVGAKDLAEERFIALAESSIFPSHAAAIPAVVGSEMVVTTPLSGIACSLVAQDAGIALVDPFSAVDFIDRGLVILPFEPTIDIRVSILTSAHRRLSAVSKEFIEAFRAHITTTGTSGWRRSRDARAGRSG